MSLPKKINPEKLKDTLVEIRYMQGIPQELMLGFVSNVLGELGYQYAPVPNQNINIEFDNSQQIAFGLGSNNGGFFIKENVRIQFVPNQIIFNCTADKYIGWEKYLQIISGIITNLFEKKAIKSFNRVGIRYISEFKNIDIYQGIKGTLDISETGLKLESSILRLADETDNLKTYVTLTNKAKRISASPQEQKIIEASLIDVSVFENFNPISDLNILWEKLNKIHAKQKEIFFGLITIEFLETLNPEY
ncbi:MAG: TIGR04255 family protein [Tannerella sp.]|jgi:uncharacterized protein (TIGR04255 family)|nr:TIGR04255 family protein [Tannerella sp.]